MADVGDTIAAQIPNCSRSFRRLLSALADSEERYGSHLSLSVADQIGRFRVWTQNIGAHRRSGKSSLDYRLRDASHIKNRVIRYLKDLDSQLAEAISITTGARTALDDMSFGSDSDSGEDEDEESRPTELEQIFLDIEQIVTCLYRLSMAVRNPTPHDRYTKAASIDTSFYEPFDIEHVRQKFPMAKEFLVSRLGKAISRRRQYLKYRELHRAKLAKPSQPLELQEIVLPDKSVISSTKLTETTASAFVERTSTKEADFEFADMRSESGATQTSYATSSGSTTKVRMPPTPKGAANGQPFECPYCYMIDTVKDTRAWMRHVYRDLEPYVCTAEVCSTANELYGGRHQWFKHETEKHRSKWTCNGHCDKQFDAAEDLVTHFRSIYADTFPESQIPALVEMCKTPWSSTTTSSCPLCNIMTAQIEKHVGRHLEELALFALPNAAEGSDESSEGSQWSTSKSSASSRRGTSTHWARTVMEKVLSVTLLKYSDTGSVLYDVNKSLLHIKLAKEQTKLTDFEFESGDLIVSFYLRRWNQKAWMYCKRRKPSNQCCLPLTSLRLIRRGSMMNVLKTSREQLQDWVTLRFLDYEHMILFHCVFFALRTQESNSTVKIAENHVLDEEIVQFSGYVLTLTQLCNTSGGYLA